MILFRDSTSKHWSIECANLRTSWRLNPLIFLEIKRLKTIIKVYLESILLDQLVQVHREQLKGHAYVIAEVEALEHVHQIHVVVFVLK